LLTCTDHQCQDDDVRSGRATILARTTRTVSCCASFSVPLRSVSTSARSWPLLGDRAPDVSRQGHGVSWRTTANGEWSDLKRALRCFLNSVSFLQACGRWPLARNGGAWEYLLPDTLSSARQIADANPAPLRTGTAWQRDLSQVLRTLRQRVDQQRHGQFDLRICG
jgi:hypothetical protein